VHFFPRGTTVNSDCCIETLRNLNACLCLLYPKRRCLMCCCFMTMLGCTQMCVPEAITNFGWTVATSTQKSWPCTITCLILWKKAYEDTIMPMMMHCKMSCATGCRGGRPTVTRQEYVLFFKGGRRLLTQMEKHWKTTVPSAVLFWNSVKFSNVELVNSIKQKIGGTAFCLPLVHMCIHTWINIWPSYVVSLL